jgi:hypothetical protein
MHAILPMTGLAGHFSAFRMRVAATSSLLTWGIYGAFICFFANATQSKLENQGWAFTSAAPPFIAPSRWLGLCTSRRFIRSLKSYPFMNPHPSVYMTPLEDFHNTLYHIALAVHVYSKQWPATYAISVCSTYQWCLHINQQVSELWTPWPLVMTVSQGSTRVLLPPLRTATARCTSLGRCS